MELKKWIEESELTQRRIARTMDVAESSLYQLRYRKYSPGLLMALMLRDISRQAVTMEELLSVDDAVTYKKWKKGQKHA